MLYNVTIINEEKEHVTHENLSYVQLLALVEEMNSLESYIITAFIKGE